MCVKKSYWVNIWNKGGKVTGWQGRLLNGKLSILCCPVNYVWCWYPGLWDLTHAEVLGIYKILTGNLCVGFEIILKRFKKIRFEIWFHLYLDGIRLHYLEKIGMNLRGWIYSANIFIRWQTVSSAQRSYTIKLFTGITFIGVRYKEWEERWRIWELLLRRNVQYIA